MRKLDDKFFVGVEFFRHGSGNIVSIDGVKYLWLPRLWINDVGANIIAVGCDADLLFDFGCHKSAVDDEGGRRRR